MFTNISHVQNSGDLNEIVSDHLPIFFYKKKVREIDDFECTTGRCYAHYDKENYQEDILNDDLSLGNIFGVQKLMMWNCYGNIYIIYYHKESRYTLSDSTYEDEEK